MRVDEGRVVCCSLIPVPPLHARIAVPGRGFNLLKTSKARGRYDMGFEGQIEHGS